MKLKRFWDLIPANSSLLRSLALKSPVRDELFVEIKYNQKYKPHRGDLYLTIINISQLTLNY